MASVKIDRRFRGPPESGNGGYVAGRLARELGGHDCAVRLHRPPPLDTCLDVAGDGAAVRLVDGADTVASASPATVDLAPPPAITLAEARLASARFTGFRHHHFPGCFVCGPEREPGDGLRIFPGAAGDGLVAAPWEPGAELLGPDGAIRGEFIWAALDCPGYFAVEERAGLALLGELAVRLCEPPAAGAPLVVVGWPVASSGRKHRAGTAIFAGDRLMAIAAATWISLRSDPL